MTEEIKSNFVNNYFSEEGLNYSLVRLPIGNCDFSKKLYSYSKKADLSDFSIKQDNEDIIPMLKDITKLKNVEIFSTPWSPPKFMKNNKMLKHGGRLIGRYRQNFADYFVKYIKAYLNEGFKINYITIQNEPDASQSWESCLYDSN